MSGGFDEELDHFLKRAASASWKSMALRVPVMQLQGQTATIVGACFCTLDESSVAVALRDGILTSVSSAGARCSIRLMCASRLRPENNSNQNLAELTEPSSVTIHALLQHVALERQEDAVDLLKERLFAERQHVLSRSLLACFEAVGWNATRALAMRVAHRAFADAGRSDMVAWITVIEEIEESLALRAHLQAAVENFDLQMRKERTRLPSSPPQDARSSRTRRHAAAQASDYSERMQQQRLECLQGRIRCSLISGELHKGMQLAADLDDPCIYRQCARILLRLGHKRHGARMLHKAGEAERAAVIYTRDLDAALLIAECCRRTEVLIVAGHSRTFCLTSISCSSATSMSHPFLFFRRARSDFRGAVEMLCVAGKEENAISLAEATHEVATLAEVLKDEASLDQHLRVSKILASHRLFSQAARHKALADRPRDALELFLRNSGYIHEQAYGCLVSRLACRSGQLLEAAKISLALAESYKKAGQFVAAHGQLLKSLLLLKKTATGFDRAAEEPQYHGICKGEQGARARLYARTLHHFALLHFYLRVPRLVDNGNRYEAALLLIRLSSYVSEQQNPDTSTRGCRPCLECYTNIEEDAVSCRSCQCPAPLCAASGLHLTGGQCAVCPVCQIPINAEALEGKEPQPDCPVCGERLDKAEWLLMPLNEAASSALYLQHLT
ncbi:hypothetical protein ACSSS7_006333 [Eimeria intestinalis]